MPDDRALMAADPTEGVDAGEYLRISTDEDPSVAALQDEDDAGGSWVPLPGQDQEDERPDPARGFYANLAGILGGMTRQSIVTDLLRKVEQDKEAWDERDRLYAEGIKRTGLGNDAPGGAEFEGASKAVHPMITEACIDYQARIMKELFPPQGPVKPRILGKPTQEKADKAKRKTEFMNYQLRSEIKEARPVLETTFTQVALAGSQFVRLWYDGRLKRPRMEFAALDRIKVPANAADFTTAHRKTYIDTVTATEFKERIEQGMYLDLDLSSPGMVPDPTKPEAASRKVEGVDTQSTNVDGSRELYEISVQLEMTADTAEELTEATGDEPPETTGLLYPYLITVDVTSRQMVAMYRNWEKGDDKREALEHIFEFPFIPWRGAFSIGFPHMIGSLSGAATGAMRALLDSALANTLPGGLILKGSATSGQTVAGQIGSYTEVGSNTESTDIRQVVMPFSPNQPAPVLFQLLGFLVETARGVVRTSMDDQATDSASPVPVGTQLSRVEEGLVVFSAVHGRAHAAMTRLLGGLHRLNRLYLPDTVQIDDDGGEIFARRADFEGSCDVQPVSDPTIYSDQQRFAQLEYIQQRALVNPTMWKMREIELAGLKLIRWPDPEALLNDVPTPHELNAVNENLAMALGQPVAVFPTQDHLAHIQVLLDFMQSPMLGMNIMFAPRYLPAALKHLGDHIAYLYVSETIATIQNASGEDPAMLMSTDPEVKAALDGLLASASRQTVAGVAQLLEKIQPVVQAAMQMMKQFQPPQPIDPAQAALQAATNETQRRAAADQASTSTDQQKNAADAQNNQEKNAIAAAAVNQRQDAASLDANTKITTTHANNMAALQIASEKIESGNTTGFSDGASMRG